LILSDPSHQFKVRRNAEQFNLTGACIFNPSFNLVYVEGAAKFMKNFRRLMLHRIAWTEPARSRAVEDVELEDPNSDADGGETERKASDVTATAGKGKESDTGDGEKSLEANKCYIVWEGALRDREYNSFRAKSCPTDRDAKDFLGDKLKGYWDVAKNWKPEEDNFF
jgi:U4/U6 small nuclear ribonucleoprotein PRP3